MGQVGVGEQRIQRRMSGSPNGASLTSTGGPASVVSVRRRVSQALGSHWGVLIVFPSVVMALGLFLVWTAQDALRGSNLELAEARMRDQARQVSEHLGLALGQAETILDDLGSFASTIDADSEPSKVAPALRKLVDGRPGASYISVSFAEGTFMGAFVDADGTLRFQVSRLKGGFTEERVYDFGPRETLVEREVRQSQYDPRERPFYQLALKSRTKAWTPPYTFARTGDTGITLTEAIWLDAAEKERSPPHAVLTIDFDVRRLSSLLDRAAELRARPLLYNKEGTILADPQAKLHERVAKGGELLNYRKMSDSVLTAFFEQHVAKVRDGFSTFPTPRGAHLAATAPLVLSNGLDWTVAFIAPEASFLATLKSYTRRSYVLAAIALFVATLASASFARLLVRMRKDAAEARDAERRARRAAKELGSYRLIERLGEGGMGEVWRAQHRMLAREAAIKLIKTDSSETGSSVAQERFRREAQSLASLRSRNTIEIFDYGVTEEGTFFYVMELLDGVDLENLVERDGPQPASRVVKLLIQACRSLAEAHEAGLVHRDVKPANIFVCRMADELDVVKVLDFGLVRSLDADLLQQESSSTKPADAIAALDSEVQSHPLLTHAGNVMGTPGFMAPEQILGEQVDGRADLYSLGCVAFWLLTAQPVFDRPHSVAMLSAHLAHTPPSLMDTCSESLPKALVDLLESCLAKSPDGRPQSAAQLMSALQELDAEMGPQWDRQVEEWWREHQLLPLSAVKNVSEAALAQTIILGVDDAKKRMA